MDKILNYLSLARKVHELTRKYNYFLNADTLLNEQEVFDYARYILPNLHVENAILHETEQDLTIMCGIELLFSESMELCCK